MHPKYSSKCTRTVFVFRQNSHLTFQIFIHFLLHKGITHHPKVNTVIIIPLFLRKAIEKMKISQPKFDITSKKQSYSHTDLACECPAEAKNLKGAHFRDFSVFGYDASELCVTDSEAEEATGRAIGRYVTLYCPDMTCPETLDRGALTDAVRLLISEFIRQAGFELTNNSTVLIAGLGNRFITSDSIGPRVGDNVLATAHLNKSNPSFASLGIPSVSVITPGVSSQTGIESAELVKAAAKTASADLIIAIDALAARSTERLCTTVQISDNGINPGSGIGNHRTPITKETMGCPVIAVGIPTVISSATLVYDSLEKAGITQITPALESILDGSEGFFVSLGESDTICSAAADILSDAIEHAFMNELFG